MADTRKVDANAQKPNECSLMESVVAQVSEQAGRIGYGFIRLPKGEVEGWIVMMDGEDAERMLIQIIEQRKHSTTE